MSATPGPEPEVTGAYQPARPPGERFAPGEVLAGRYRLVAALGRGGMGEVYRADDLALGQAVALKFLPTHLATDPGRLDRFRKEVAAARRVSHPNVCRVYDIVEHAGEPFLAMEFVDGEDLAALLRRVGRLSEEKGLEVARQLCGALAAVHDLGLLHRDLKPANVMLDGRGRVRLTDFGLTAAAGDLSATEIRSGTPLYQAPEQRTGTEVTARSDVFALGLVLYELFTGRRPFPDARRGDPPSKPSSHVSGLDPAVERVILRCLESDPAHRPRGAVEVLAELPVGDPLAAAVAAGETPSPRLVAAGAGDDPVRPWVVAALLWAVVAGIAANVWLSGRVQLAERTPLRDADPALMRYKAREALAALGHDEPPGDSALRYTTDHEAFRYLRDHAPGPDRWAVLGDGRPPAVVVLYRAARGPLVVTNPHSEDEMPGLVTPLNPPPLEPGMVDISLDLGGRLLRFHKVADFLAPNGGAPLSPDWRAAFRAAGLDFDAFAPATPRHRSPLATDARFAWEGPYPDPVVNRVRVEAAALGGRPMYFAVEFPWQAGAAAAAYPTFEYPPQWYGQLFVMYGLPLLAAGLAGWNWQVGRADTRGALILGGGFFAAWLLRWAATAHHVPDSREHLLVMTGLGLAVFMSVVPAVYYLALEPFVRRRWPRRLIGWSRLLAGRGRDPLVGRDVLIGLAAAGAFNLGVLIHSLAYAPTPFFDDLVHPARVLQQPLYVGTRWGLAFFFVLFVMCRVCRREWLGVAVTVGFILATFYTPNDPAPLATAALVLVNGTGLLLLALRFGLLAFTTAFVAGFWYLHAGALPRPGVWYATGSYVALGAIVATTLFAAYRAAGGARLFRDEAGRG